MSEFDFQFQNEEYLRTRQKKIQSLEEKKKEEEKKQQKQDDHTAMTWLNGHIIGLW